MRRIKRARFSIPQYILDNAQNEHNANIHGVQGQHSYEIKKNVYSNHHVREAIISLNDHKCGFCGGTTKLDVALNLEHYRPAKRVHYGKKNKFSPGYYWLTAEWNNILPSCSACNLTSQREYFDYQDHSWKQHSIGKGNKFPLLKQPTARPLHTNNIAFECPLFFNPCVLDPKLIFAYHEFNCPSRGPIVFITPKISCTPLQRQISETSIFELGLNRLSLCLNRRSVVIKVSTLLGKIETTLHSTVEYQIVADLLNELIPIIDWNYHSSSYIGMIWTLKYSSLLILANSLNEVLHEETTLNSPQNIIHLFKVFQERYQVVRTQRPFNLQRYRLKF